MGSVSNTSALLLADNGSTRLYFAPNADYNGTSSAALTVRAWDQTSGTAGTKVTTASNGGTTAFSSVMDTIDVTVTAIDDAPVAAGGTVIGSEDTPYVFTWADLNVLDIDSAITGATAIQIITLPADGVLAVSNGFSWEPVTAGQTITKSTIDAGLLRFTPEAQESGYDAYPTPGVGNLLQDYAQFTYRPVQTIAITNPDAELGITYAEGTGNNVAAGWVTSGSVYTSNVSAAAYADDHDQVFSLSSGAQMSQVLSTNFSAALDYTISVDVGWHPAWSSPSFQVELWAGGTRVGVVDQSAITPVIGAFVRATLVVDGSAFGAADGQPLEIRLSESSGFSNVVQFDNVMLTTLPGGIGSTATLTIDITPQNDAPVITPIAPDVTFVEGGLPQVIDATGTITDVDSTNLDGGVMTVSISANGTVDDRLQVGNFGTGPGQVGVSGSNVTYGGTVIGTVSGGTNGSDPLVITFNTNATPSAVQEVYRSMQFNNVSENPSTATRTLTIGLTDGDGGTATPQTKLVYVQASNDAPSITSLSGDSLSYSEGDGAVVIEQDGNALVADVDSTNFDTGTLTVSFTAGSDSAEDVLSIRNQGTGAGQIGVSGSNITYGGTTIGTFTGGSGGSNLVITLNVSATPTAVTALVQTITYENTDTAAPTTGARTVRFVLTDGDGGTSANYNTTVTVSAVNDAPVVDLNGTGAGQDVTTAFTEQTSVVIAPSGTLSDVDSATLTSLTVTLTARPDGNAVESLALNAPATTAASGAGLTVSYTAGTGVLSITGSASVVTYQTILQGIQYHNTSDTPTTTDRSITVVAHDGTAPSGTQTATLTVTAQNDPPVNTVPGPQSVAEDTPLALGGISVTDVDGNLSTVQLGVGNGTLTVTLQGAASISAGANGSSTLTLAGPQADLNATLATLVYQGASNYSGADTLTVTSTDSNAVSDVDTVALTVTAQNDPPALATNTGSTVLEGDIDTITSAELSVTDPDQAAAQMVYSVGTLPTNGHLERSTAPGVAITSFTQAEINAGLLRYVHDGSETATDSFTFTVNDGAGGSIGATTFTITVAPSNDAPTNTVPGLQTVTGGNPLVFSLANGTQLAISDVDALGGTIQVTLTSPDGLLTLSGTAGLTFNVGDGTADPTMTFTGTVASVNTALNGMQFAAASSFSGQTTLQLATNDLGNTGAGGPRIATSTVPITVGTPPLVIQPPSPPQPPQTPQPSSPPIGATPAPSRPPAASTTIGPIFTAPSVSPTPPFGEAIRPHEDTRRTPLAPRTTSTPAPLIPLASIPTDLLAWAESLGQHLQDQAPLEKIVAAPGRVSHALRARLQEFTDYLEQTKLQETSHRQFAAQVAAGSGLALSAGFITWLLRGGSLLASLLASMPAWRYFDPIPVLKLDRDQRKRRDRIARAAADKEYAEYKGLEDILEDDVEDSEDDDDRDHHRTSGSWAA